MLGIVLAIGLVALLAGCSIQAAARYRTVERLPMQWSIGGRVIWSAPRRIALAFTPILAALVVGGTAILLTILPPRGNGAVGGVGVLAIMATCFIVAHVFHLWLINRTLSRR